MRTATADDLRKTSLFLALVGLTLALGIGGGNLRNGVFAFVEWSGWHQAAFIACLIGAVLSGWWPVRDYWRGDWRPFIDSSALEYRDEQGHDRDY